MKILTKVVSFVLVLCLIAPLASGLILGFDFGIVSEAFLDSSASTVYFKAGSRNYLKSGVKYTTDTEVIAKNGKIYLPTSILKESLSITSPDNTVTVDGVECVAAVHGARIASKYYISVSNMNLVAVSTYSNVFANATDAEQIAFIEKFAYDSVNSDRTKNDVVDFSLVQSATHPYITASQSQFDYLNRVWNGSETDEVLKGYLDYLVSNAQGVYNSYANSDGSLNKTKGLVSGKQTSLDDMPYYAGDSGSKPVAGTINHNGYDVGGRQNEAAGHTERIERLAFAYQVTRDEKYARLALDYAVAICSWEHWGAGHFLNAADAALHMSYAYDMCYNAWKSIDSAKLQHVKEGLFTKGVMAGVYDSVCEIDNTSYLFEFAKPSWAGIFDSKTQINCPWYDPKVGHNPYYDRENNWNAVCTSGMMIAALSFINDTDTWTNLTITAIDKYGVSHVTSANPHNISDIVGSTYRDTAAWLINNNLYNHELYGLTQYVPDGSYIESAGYWNYGTSSIFRTVAALDTVFGTDFGLSAGAGLDRTAYYSYYVQSSEGDVWRYHDDNGTTLPTPVNALYGAVIGDDNIVAYRKYLIAKGSTSPTMYDTFRYDPSVTQFDEMALDYYMQSCEGYTMRSSWNDGAIYTGFMGGNNYYAHGQVDAGAFIYYNNGTKWFEDIGTENYNAKNFSYGLNANGLKYYPCNAEGNNVLLTTGLTYGQEWNTAGTAFAPIEKHGSNKYGAYAVLDQSAIYSSVSSGAKRGMLMTNDRKTVVLQDEVTFTSAQDAYWVAHVSRGIDITFSEDGKTAYMNDGNSIIRVTLISNGDYSFSKKNFEYSEDYMLLDWTHADGNWSVNNGGQPQNDYSAYQRLMIECKGATNLQLAVVIEEYVPGENYAPAYEWRSMTEWNDFTPSPDGNTVDGKTLLDIDFDEISIGKLNSSVGNLSLEEIYHLGDGAVKISSNSGNTAASVIDFVSAYSKTSAASIGNGMIVAEFDLAKSGEIPTGTYLSFMGTDINPMIDLEINSANLGTLTTSFTHITVVIDGATNTYYVFAGDKLTVSGTYRTSSFEELKLRIYSEKGSTGSASGLILDNIKMRSYSESYTKLDSILTAGRGMSAWEHRDLEMISTRDYVATVYTSEGEQKNVATFNELATALNSGTYNYAELFAHSDSTISISKPVKVNTNGYNFYATSSSYVTMVDGDIYSYEKGKINVTYHIGDFVYTTTLSLTKSASYNASSDKLTGIREVADYDEDGKLVAYSYLTKENNTWARSEGGRLLTGGELIITSENNEFYIGEVPYTGLYVTVRNGNITGGTTAQGFFSAVGSTTAYDRISVTNSFSYDGSSNGKGATINANVNLYLNGNTITYTSGSGQHMLFMGSAKNLNVYGPGKIVNNSKSNIIIMFYTASNTKRYYATFDNVTIESSHVICDQRSGTLEFKNCDIDMTAQGVNVFTVDNWSSPNTNSYSDEHQLPILIVNGGVVNASCNKNQSVIDISNNVHLVVKGNAHFNAPSSKALLKVENTGNHGIELMTIKLGAYTYNAPAEHYFNLTTAEEVASHISYIDTITTDDTSSVTLASGYIWARTGSDIEPWCSIAETDAVKVIWQAGLGKCTEYWIPGVIPTPSDDALAMLAKLSTTGYAYENTYDMSSMVGKTLEGGKVYTFTARELHKVDIKVNMTLESNMLLNIYIEKYDGMTLNSVMADGKEFDKYNVPVEKIGTKNYYKISIDVAHKRANEVIAVYANMDDGDKKGVTITAAASVLGYLNDLMLASDTAENVKVLIASLVDYIGAVANYSGERSVGTLCKKYSERLSDTYGVKAPTDELLPESIDTSAIRPGISSVRLALGSKTAFLFNFDRSYTGKITISYTSLSGDEVTKTFMVSGGKAAGMDHFRLEMSAFDMMTDITVEIDGVASIYNFAAYYTAVVEASDELYDVLTAIYAYSLAAADFANF